jgi:hypothetical protein
MSDAGYFVLKVNEEMDRFFDDSSLSTAETPVLVLIWGAVAVGKTTLRKKQFSSGYVIVDAVEVFLNLCRGEYLPFPGPLEQPMAVLGRVIADRAIRERRNIVTEIIGADFDQVRPLVEAMLAVGYRVDITAVTCDDKVAEQWNLERGDDVISAFYAESFQRTWLTDAATQALAEMPADGPWQTIASKKTDDQ